MYDNYFFYIIILFIVGSVIYRYLHSQKYLVKKKLKETTQENLSLFQSGEVAKATGTIKYIGEPLIAPLSGRKCVYYHIIVEERRSSGKSSYWDTIIEENIAGNVVIKDGNTYAVIETNQVKSYVVDDKQYRSGTFEDATELMRKYLEKHNRTSVNFLGFNNSIRYQEGILEEGELIAVVGKGTWKRKSEIKLDIPAERILVIGSDGEEFVYFTDDQTSLS
jgi:hypothetical protein